jgi:hypothetical protein
VTDVDVSVEESPDQSPTVVVPVVQNDIAVLMPVITELVEKVTRLESAVIQTNEEVAEVAVEASVAEVIAENAQDTADLALEIAADAERDALEATELVLETAEETGVLDTVLEETDTSIVPDVTPRRSHWLFRSMDEWKQKISA